MIPVLEMLLFLFFYTYDGKHPDSKWIQKYDTGLIKSSNFVQGLQELNVTSINQTMVLYGNAHRVMVKWYGVLDEQTASIFIVAELVWMNAKLVRKIILSIRQDDLR